MKPHGTEPRFLQRLVRLFRVKRPSNLSDKILVILGDGRHLIADNQDEAQAIVMTDCLKSGCGVCASFRPATEEEIAAHLPNDPSSAHG